MPWKMSAEPDLAEVCVLLLCTSQLYIKRTATQRVYLDSSNSRNRLCIDELFIIYTKASIASLSSHSTGNIAALIFSPRGALEF